MTNTELASQITFSHMVRVTQVDGTEFPVALVDLEAAEGFIEGLKEDGRYLPGIAAWKLFERVGCSEIFREV